MGLNIFAVEKLRKFLSKKIKEKTFLVRSLKPAKFSIKERIILKN